MTSKPKNLEELAAALYHRQLDSYMSIRDNWKIEEPLEWFFFTLSFLDSTNKLLLHEPKKTLSELEGDKKVLNYQFIPIIYNLRHAIELELKTIALILKVEISQLHIHDIEKMYDIVSDKLNNYKLTTEEIQSYNEQSSTQHTGVAIKRQLIAELGEIHKLVIKYYHHFLLTDSIKPYDILISDVKNETFKYPVSFSTTVKFRCTNFLNLTTSAYSTDMDIFKLKSSLQHFVNLRIKQILPGK